MDRATEGCRLECTAFQSLSRDSVCLDLDAVAGESSSLGVSIPESGFCLFGPLSGSRRRTSTVGFQSLSRDSVCLDPDSLQEILDRLKVSIPESGFCLFGPRRDEDEHRARPFQSLSRDSVCLDRGEPPQPTGGKQVSIPESGFCLFGLLSVALLTRRVSRFNP